MSVKSLTVVADDDGRDVCVLLRTLDGHLTGHGAELRAFLRGYIIARSRIIDGEKAASTIGRLASALVSEFSVGIGDFELLPSDTRHVGEEYVYTVYAHHTIPKMPSLLNLRIEADFSRFKTNDSADDDKRMTVIYDGLLDEFDPMEVLAQWSHGPDALQDYVDARVAQARAAVVGSHTT
jgi:hypothetical protein